MRLHSVAAVGAGLLWAVSGVLALVYKGEHEPGTAADLLVEGTFTVAVALTAVALFGLHLPQRDGLGTWGSVAFYAFVASAAVQLVVTVGMLAGMRAWAVAQLPLGLVALVALVLYGTATLQARRWPRWIAIGLIAGLPFAFITGLFGGNIVFGAFWVAVGWRLWVTPRFEESKMAPTAPI